MVECLQMRRPASHVEPDDPLRLGGMVQRLEDALPAFELGLAPEELRIKERRERPEAHAGAGAAEEGAAGEGYAATSVFGTKQLIGGDHATSVKSCQEPG